MDVSLVVCFFFNDTATTEIYTLSLRDALPIFRGRPLTLPEKPRSRPRPRPLPLADEPAVAWHGGLRRSHAPPAMQQDRKSTRLNSSHANISYAVFCLKKKNGLALRLTDVHYAG